MNNDFSGKGGIVNAKEIVDADMSAYSIEAREVVIVVIN